jgi:LPXTG-motif cell wall-anchored protein
MKKIIKKVKKIIRIFIVSTVLSFFGSILIAILTIFIRRRKRKPKRISNK